MDRLEGRRPHLREVYLGVQILIYLPYHTPAAEAGSRGGRETTVRGTAGCPQARRLCFASRPKETRGSAASRPPTHTLSPRMT